MDGPFVRILHVTESHEAAAGGVTTVVQDLSRRLAGVGAEVAILAIGRTPIAPPDGVALHTVPPSAAGRPWGWHPALAGTIDRLLATRPDVVHVHGAWLAAQWLAVRAARRQGIPTVASFHGMLEPYHWSDRGLLQLARKRAYWSLLGRPAFSGATLLHAITELEARHLRALVPHPRMEVIPNAVDLAAIDAAVARLPEVAGEPPRRIVLLGRLHRKKGIDLLVRAFDAAALPSPWELVIAGPPEDPDYLHEVRQLAAASSSASRITFVPAQFGDDRWRFLRDAWLVAVPSRSEVVAMVNLEAGAVGTPTLTTTATGLLDWEAGGGRLVTPDVPALTEALRALAAESAAARLARGRASRALVESRYSWEAVLPRWRALYASVGATPVVREAAGVG